MDEALATGVFIFIVHELEELVFLHGWESKKASRDAGLLSLT